VRCHQLRLGSGAETSGIGSQDHRSRRASRVSAGRVQRNPGAAILARQWPRRSPSSRRENFANGADLIKIVVDAGAGPTGQFRYLSREDAKAAVEDAHRLGLIVAAHATSKVAIQTEIDAGVDSVEHGDEATDQQLKRMKDKGIVLVTTDLWSNGLQYEYFRCSVRSRPQIGRRWKASQEKTTEQFKDRLQRAMKIGVKIAMGSDMWCLWLGKTRDDASLLELVELQKNGMPSLESIGSSTVNAAEAMGWSDRVGEIAAGKFADIIAVAADPRQDITSLQRVGFVMKGARVVKNEMAEKRS
jgi:imidazolonepropionase-like amidohydrolase